MSYLGLEVTISWENVISFLTEAQPKSPCIILDIQECNNPLEAPSTLERIKAQGDYILLTKASLSSKEQEVEGAYASGFHGIIFSSDGDFFQADAKGPTYAKRLFTPGAVFVEVNDSVSVEESISLIESGLVPLYTDINRSKELEVRLKDYSLDGRWLYFLNCYRLQAEISFTDKLAKKYLLEVANLKHKLRVKNISDSYSSSSL
jgi:hypothetical protein